MNMVRHKKDISSLLSREDCFILNVFCAAYGVNLVQVLPNNETFPPKGNIYVFDNNLGGYSMEGIIKSLIE